MREADGQRLDELAAERDAAHAELVRLRDQVAARMFELEARERDVGARRRRVAAEGAAGRCGARGGRARLAAIIAERNELAQRADRAAADVEAAERAAADARDSATRMQRRIVELESADLRAAELEGEERGARSVHEGAPAS